MVNQIRGLLLERGTTLRKGRRYVDEALPCILAGGSSKLSGAVLVLLAVGRLRQNPNRSLAMSTVCAPLRRFRLPYQRPLLPR